MTNKQPEALIYADKLEKVFGLSEYADEIRRLHQSEREGWRYADEVEQERKLLHEVNVQLMKAIRQSDLTLVNTVNGYALMKLGVVTAHDKAEGK